MTGMFGSEHDAFVGRISSRLVGDYNRDGQVDGANYVLWRRGQRDSVSAFTGADGNGDGVVNSDDYAIWRANFGNSQIANGAAAVAVPEARSIVLFLICLVAVCAARRFDCSGHRQKSLVGNTFVRHQYLV
jgi:hypothetical protein